MTPTPVVMASVNQVEPHILVSVMQDSHSLVHSVSQVKYVMLLVVLSSIRGGRNCSSS